MTYAALHRTSVASTLALILAAASPAMAAGTGAGVLIENTAEASYDVGGTNVRVLSNTVVIKVDEVVDVSVAGQGVSQPDAGTAVFSFRVTNTGNGSEAYNLTVDPAQPGNDFQLTVTQLVIDDGDGIYEPGVDVVLPAGSATNALAADTGLTVFVVTTLPAGTQDGDTSAIKLNATAVTGSGTPGTVYAGQGDGGVDAVVGPTTATQGAVQTLTSAQAQVALVKSATVVDPFGGAEAVPGALVTFSIVASVTGTGAADALRITDAIPAGTTYEPGTLKLDNGALSDAIDGDAGSASGSGIDVALGSPVAGTSRTVTFQVKIN